MIERLLRQPKTIIFDFDGVILDSARLKTQAFAQTYQEESADKIGSVVAYQEQNGGIGRREKFVHFETTLFGRSGDDTSVERLCAIFSGLIETAMLNAPFVPGALETLNALKGRLPIHLVSGMPEDELEPLLLKRQLHGFFSSVAGSPKKKYEEFVRIVENDACEPKDVLAVGDSLTEYHAAERLGIPFLAVLVPGAPDFFPSDVARTRDLCGFAEQVLAGS